MNIKGYAITKPSCILVHSQLPSHTFCKSHVVTTCFARVTHGQNIRMCFMPRVMYSAAGRSMSRSVDYTASKRNTNTTSTSSLYSRPSLLEMKKQKMENRAKVYEFLRGIGILPGELDGLELPVTVDVMRERVDFLHELGLTIQDINSYPLVLGCSVKKNMIPVLDYLGKIGVRKSVLADFLRRYPQVLHASVVVDLQPVVKYLQGMDIKPADIPRVLERYPEVLGFKLEGTMSTSVAYLVGIGVGRREIGSILTRYPEILGMRVARFIKPFVDYLEGLGIPRLAVARLIEKRPHILGFGLDERVKTNIKLLLEYEVREGSLGSVIAQHPDIIGVDLKPKLSRQRYFLASIVDLGPKDFGRMIEKMPEVISLNAGAISNRVDFLMDCGFSMQQIKKMVVGCPQLLALRIDIMKLSFDYFKAHMHNRPLDDLVSFPAFFTYGLESTIRPRHEMVAKKGFECSLAWLLNCSDEKFEDRMSYESIDPEEMEPERTFDMNSFMGMRSDDSPSDYDDDDDDDDDDEF
ncbi:Transcription termination factor mterf4, chloroplastic [Dionaea muscipula]